MILLLILSNILFILISLTFGILYFKAGNRCNTKVERIDKEIERAENILNNIVIRLKSK